jgi:hypothetical protein
MEPVEQTLSRALLTVLVCTQADELPEYFREIPVEGFDTKHQVQILGGPELAPQLLHAETGGRAADQDVAVCVIPQSAL